jgi:Tfp pilus assembly protein PilV
MVLQRQRWLTPSTAAGRRGDHRRSDRVVGALLVELVIAIAVLVVGLLGFLYATQANFSATRDMATRDLVSTAFANAVEALSSADFSTLYVTYNNTYLVPPVDYTEGPSGETQTEIGELKDSAGNPARVQVNFDVNETALPSEYGPVADIDGDGALNTTDCSATYEILPTRLTLTFQTPTGTETRTLHLVLGTRG